MTAATALPRTDGGQKGAASPGLEALFNASPIGVGFLVDRVFREVNERLCDMTGYGRDELIGRSERMLCASEAAFVAIGDALSTELTAKGEMRLDTLMRRKDGQIIDVALHMVALKPGDLAAGVVVSVIDVMAYRRAQALLQVQAEISTTVGRGDRQSLLAAVFRAALVATRSAAALLVLPGPDAVVPWLEALGVAGIDGTVDISLHADGASPKALSDDSPLVCCRPQSEAAARAHAPVGLGDCAPAGGRRALAVPLVRDGAVVAVLTVADKAAPYLDDEADLLRQMASMAVDGLTALRARADLRVSEARAQLASDVAGIGVWDWDIASGRVSVNQAYLRMLGMEQARTELDINQWTALIHPDDRDRIAAEGEAALASDATFRTEYRLRTAAGEWCQVLSSGRVFERDPQGRPRRMIGTHTDITELRRTEAELQSARARLELALEGGDLGLFEIQVVDGAKQLSVDDRYLAQIGLTPADGPFTVDGWFERLHPDDHEHMLGMISDLEAGRADTWETEYRLRHADGGWRWILDRSRVFARTADGMVQRAAGAHLDITELRQTQADLEDAHARLELALEGGELGLFEVNVLDGVPQVTVDDRYLAQIGLTRADGAFTVERWLALLHPDDRERILRLTADTEAGRLDAWDTEYRLRHADGGWRWILDRSRVFERSANGRRQRIAGAHLDITERKAAEAALAELNRTLEERVAGQTAELRRQAGQLRALAGQLSRTEQRERKRLATILHDHIQQLIVAAQMQVTSMTRATDAAGLRQAARSVDAVLKEALEASRSLAVELSPPVLRESGLIAALNWLVARARERHGLAVRLRADAAAQPADDDLCYLLFECARELLLNVVKHADVEHAEMTLLRSAVGEIRLIVNDTGRGFDPDGLKQLPSAQMSFGLFSIQERLAHIGGRMDIASAPGQGTQVFLIVSVDDQQMTAQVNTAPDAPDAPTVAVRHRRRRCRVLIVDDHQIMRDGLAGLLQVEPDIEVVGQAADGEQAIAQAVALRPDVIIMDVNLGAGIDGIEATRRVLAADAGITVIGLSMHAERGVGDAMRAAGAAAYVTKGGPPEHLIEAIRAHRGA